MRNAAWLALMLCACEADPPTILDGSTPQAFERTAKQARQNLPVADRIVFDRALRTVGGRRHAVRDPEALARTTFDGMTAEQIVADQKARDN
jgi:hypothetical protein